MSRSSLSPEKTTIEVWLAEHPFPNYYGEHFLDPMRRRAEEFGTVHPEFRINIHGHDFRAMAQDVARAAEQGNPPDVAEYYATAAQTARDTRAADGRPLFTSIGTAVGGREEILGEPVVIDDLEPGVRDYYSYDGELLSLPPTATTAVLFTNMTALRAAGVGEIPRTWDEVEAAAKAISGAAHPPSHGITWPNHGWLFQQAVAVQGGLLADHDNGRSGRAMAVDLASDEMLAWVEWWLRLSGDGHHLYAAGWPEAIGAFARQDVALLISSSKTTEEIVQLGRQAGFDVAVSPMPHNDQVAPAGHLVSGQSLWLADGLEEAKRDGALAFMQYLINPRNAAEWHKAVGFMPVTGASYDLLTADGWFTERPHQRVANEQLRASDGSPAALGALLGDFAGIQDVMTRAMEDVLGGETQPLARFTRATSEAQRLLDDYNSDCLAIKPRTPRSLNVG